jgi:hypothetical protein
MSNSTTNNTQQQQATNYREKARLSGNTQKAAKEFLKTLSELCELYKEETDALKNSKTQHFSMLQALKINLGQKYEYQIQQIMERREEFQGLPQDIKDEIKLQRENFSLMASDNLKAMEQVQKATSRLNDMIMGMAREQVSKKGFNYTGHGNLHQTERAISMGFSESA